jgi:isochorismate synthase
MVLAAESMDAGWTEYDSRGVREFVARQLDEPIPRDAIALFWMPAPRARLQDFLTSQPRELRMVWYPRSGEAFAGFGAAARINLTGDGRMVELSRAARDVFRRLRVFAHPGIVAPSARLFGGLAFAAGENTEPPWAEFGDGDFTLPRWVYGRDGKSVHLGLAIDPTRRDSPNYRLEALGELDEILAVLEDAEQERTFGGVAKKQKISRSRVHRVAPDSWREHVEKIRSEIRRGRFEKVVAAKRTWVDAPAAIDDVELLARLAFDYPSCHRFLFRRGNRAFVGASPETLFRKTGTSFTTQALAGTLRAGDGGAIDKVQMQTLLASKKDHHEHDIVVREILARLAPLTAELTAANTPEIRRVGNLIHLDTPISGRVKEGVLPVEILAALHPTPAVGGVPQQAAIEFISRTEPHSRGWYTGPVGWIDEKGDGEFAVAIRCGVISGKEAFIYAGAGIVADSDPDAEYQETELKAEPLLHSLGVEPLPSPWSVS